MSGKDAISFAHRKKVEVWLLYVHAFRQESYKKEFDAWIAMYELLTMPSYGEYWLKLNSTEIPM